jgi:hypothetical protein
MKHFGHFKFSGKEKEKKIVFKNQPIHLKSLKEEQDIICLSE